MGAACGRDLSCGSSIGHGGSGAGRCAGGDGGGGGEGSGGQGAGSGAPMICATIAMDTAESSSS
ncbi:hypothetical protein BE17_38975 [Sorangium cellulosum]|uniref:Uncharacterized protein n=1 Tax=Sorangium cellulosum TaxID=56 RepID=A0A150SGJ4_SORCE|nr:hypothetical protein BE17_38975 [Sorangium cellulosum]